MVTIILPVSRDDYLRRVFTQLELMNCDQTKVNLLCYVDGDILLMEKARNLTINSKFEQRLCVFRGKGQPNVGSVKRRRQRIADIHNEIKELLEPCDYVFLVEDDTLVPINALEKLLNNFYIHPHTGIISGTQLGRWGYLHQGLWSVDDVYETNTITSLKAGDGLQKIDAAGFYCGLIKYQNYINHTFKPFEDAMGPDVDFGLMMRKEGLANYADLSIKCAHLNNRGIINFSDSKIVQVQLKRTPDVRFGWMTSSL